MKKAGIKLEYDLALWASRCISTAVLFLGFPPLHQAFAAAQCTSGTVCTPTVCRVDQICELEPGIPTSPPAPPPSGGPPGGVIGTPGGGGGTYDRNNDTRTDCWQWLAAFPAISSPYGNAPGRTDGFHFGTDITSAAPNFGQGSMVRSIAGGRVSERGTTAANGNYIKVNHADGRASYYLHLKGFGASIQVGTLVAPGDLLGTMNCTGDCFSGNVRNAIQGTHLHLEIRTSHTAGRDSTSHSTTIDPATYSATCP